MTRKLFAFVCALAFLNCALPAESDPPATKTLHVAWPETLEKSGFEISATGNHNPIGVLVHHSNKATTVNAPESGYALSFCGQSVPFKVSENGVSLWADNALGVRLDQSTNTFSFGVTQIRIDLNDCDLQCSLPDMNTKLEKSGGATAVQLIYAPRIRFDYGAGEVLFGVDDQGKILLTRGASEAGFSSENNTLTLHPQAFQIDAGSFSGTWSIAHTSLKRSGKDVCRLLPSSNNEGYLLTAQLGKGKSLSGSFFVGKDFRLSPDGVHFSTFIELPLVAAANEQNTPVTVRIGPAELDFAKWQAEDAQQREKRSAEKKALETELAKAAWQTSFKLKETIRIYSFPEQLIGYAVNFPEHLVRAEGLRLLRIGAESIDSLPFQLSEVVEKDGFLSSARVSFRTDLPIGASREFCLAFGANVPAPPTSAITFEKDNDTGILSGNELKVRVPAVQVRYELDKAPLLKDVPAPVLGLFREKEWCGKGSLVGNADLRVLAIDSHPLESGPLFARYRITYEFTSNKKYSVVLTVQQNESHLLIDETLEGFVYKDECFLQFDLDPGIHPDHRLVMGQHGYHLFSGNILNGIAPSSPFQAPSGLPPDGLQPFQIGLFTPGGYGVMRSAALYNSSGTSAFLIAVNRLRDWKTETREVWSSRACNIKFYTQNGTTFLRAPLAGTERHWAMALIPRNAVETKSILSNPKSHDGAGPEVRLWQRLADFQLDRVKDWVFDWDEKLEAPTTPPLAKAPQPLQPSAPGRKIPVFVNTSKESAAFCDAVAAKIKADARFELVAEKPADNSPGLVVGPSLVGGNKSARDEARCHFKFYSEHGQEQWDGAWSAEHQDLNQLADNVVKDIDNRGAVVTYEAWTARNGMGGFMLPEIVNYYWDYGAGAAAVSFRDMPRWFAEYARSRSTWTQEQREHVRSVLLFMTYITEDDNCQPHHSMLSGHPNFIMDVMVVLPLACAAFPNHPHAKKWRDTFMAYYDEWIRTFQRRDDPEHNAIGGRWTENIAAYSFQALHSLNLSAQALKVFDGTDLYQNSCLQAWLNWYLQALMSPHDGIRTHPPEGAHAGSPVTNPAWRPLAEMARDGAKDAPDLAAKYRWLETDGKEGTNPALHSVLIRDHGPVLRYDFGGPHEAYLHLMQIAGPYNYRWGEGSDVVYYGSKNKIWSYNLADDAGDFWRWDSISAFTVQVAATAKGDDRDDLHSQIGKPRTQGLGRHATDQPLYDFGFAQFYRALAEKPDAVYRSLGMMMLRDDYVVLQNDVTDPATPGQFVWANTSALPNIQQLKPGATATEETIEEDAKHHTGRTLKVRRYTGKGDFLTLVSADPVKAEATPFGARVADNEYIFCAGSTVNYNENDVIFSGTAGYVRPNQLALFEGTRIGWKGWRIDRDGGDFGISAELSENKVTGRIVGRKGGKVTVTLPDGVSARTAKVVVNDKPVAATTEEKTIVFEASIAQRDGYKTYSIVFGHE